MAEDLIPPRSPAGKPPPDPPKRPEPSQPPPGDDLVLATQPDEEVPRGRVPQQARFGFLTGALAGMGMAAVVVTMLLLFGGGGSSGGDSSDSTWSSWKPSGDPELAIYEIADHIGRKYRLDDGQQLVAVHAGPIAFQGQFEARLVLRTPADGDLIQVGGEGVMYTMNGLGENGSIAVGTPSRRRLGVLRRQAVELALYTFRYVEDVETVAVILPPAPPEKGVTEAPPANVLLFRAEEFAEQLNVPVELSLPDPPPRPQTIQPDERRTMEALWTTHGFVGSFEQLADGSVMFQLRPFTPASPTADPAPTPTAEASPKPE